MNDLDRMRALLQAARTEVEELEIAIRVMERIKQPGDKIAALDNSAPVKKSPMITIRRSGPAPDEGKATRTPPSINDYGVKGVAAFVAANGPMTADAIRDQMAGHDAATRSKVTKTLSNMRQNKLATVDKDGIFKLTAKGRGARKTGPRTIAAPDPARAAAERETIRHALAAAGQPMEIGTLLDAVVGVGTPKAERDRLRWAVASLQKRGEVRRTGPDDSLVSLTGVAAAT